MSQTPGGSPGNLEPLAGLSSLLRRWVPASSGGAGASDRNFESTWWGRPFGLDLVGDLPAPGLAWRRAEPEDRGTILREATPHDLERWDQAGWQPVARAGGGGPSVCWSPGIGYLVEQSGFGRHLVDASGGAVVCAPPGGSSAWHWQRLLTGQLLPLAAALAGLEPLHASAVALGDRGLLLAGASGSGKSTLALALAARGAEFLCDDVAAISVDRDGIPLVHAGPGLASTGPHLFAELEGRGGLEGARVLGVADGEARVQLPRTSARTLPVEALVLVRPTAADRPAAVRPMPSPSPRVLLGATFNPYLATGSRLLRQLEACAALARHASVLTLDAPRAAGVPPAIDVLLGYLDRAAEPQRH